MAKKIEKMRQEIKDVFKYDNGTVKVSEEQMLETYDILGGHTDEGLASRLLHAMDEDVHRAHQSLKPLIQHMKRYPRRTCTDCGNSVEERRIRTRDEGMTEIHNETYGNR